MDAFLMATIWKPAFSISASMAPVKPLRTASGLTMLKVRCATDVISWRECCLPFYCTDPAPKKCHTPSHPFRKKARNGWGTAFQNFWAGSIICDEIQRAASCGTNLLKFLHVTLLRFTLSLSGCVGRCYRRCVDGSTCLLPKCADRRRRPRSHTRVARLRF